MNIDYNLQITVPDDKMVIDLGKTGNKLKFYAKCNGYCVKDIQNYLGLSCPQPVYRWYKGKILPSIDNLFRLSKLYRIHMDDLIVTNSTDLTIFCENESHDLKKIIKNYIKKIIL